MSKLIARLTNAVFGLILVSTAANADLPATIEKIKPSIVAIGTYKKTQSPPFVFRGTGFVIEGGNIAATNAHVLPETGIVDGPELAILIRNSKGEGSIRPARVISKDTDHDLAVIRFDGPPLPALTIGDSSFVREGQNIAFTGFPIGGALGFSPVTHRGTISSITPIVLPANTSRQLAPNVISRIKNGAFNVFQLDATAYPGSSGSPVFDTDNGNILGVINMVFVKGTKEAALTSPSGISYAIPVDFLTNIVRNPTSH